MTDLLSPSRTTRPAAALPATVAQCPDAAVPRSGAVAARVPRGAPRRCHPKPASLSRSRRSVDVTDRPEDSLAAHGLRAGGRVLRNPTTSQLYTAALDRGEAVLAEDGPLVVDTGPSPATPPRTSRRARAPLRGADLVERREREIGGALRRAALEGGRAPRAARRLRDRRVLRRRPEAPPRGAGRGRRPVPRALCEDDVHRPGRGGARRLEPDVLVLHEPEVEADPAQDGTRTEVFVCLHPTRKEILIGGTFSAARSRSPSHADERPPAARGHDADACSANARRTDRTSRSSSASGTGKTTLSASRAAADRGRRARLGRRRRLRLRGRLLRQDDSPLGRGRAGDLEGGDRFGTVLENVAVDERGVLDLDDDSKTENNRAAYKLEGSRTRCRRSVPAIRDR